MFCQKCGKQIDDNVKFCVYCGAETSAGGANPGGQYNSRSYQNNQGYQNNQPYQNNQGYQYNNTSGQQNKGYAIAAYITWIGFIIAILAGDRHDPLTRFHLNQALVLNVFSIIASIVAQITIVGAIIGWIASIVIFVCWIIGLVGACKGEYKEVPIFGRIHWIK